MRFESCRAQHSKQVALWNWPEQSRACFGLLQSSGCRRYILRRGTPMFRLVLGIATAVTISGFTGRAQQSPAAGPYKVLKTAKVGGDGGFDYVNVDVENRRLYIARTGKTP